MPGQIFFVPSRDFRDMGHHDSSVPHLPRARGTLSPIVLLLPVVWPSLGYPSKTSVTPLPCEERVKSSASDVIVSWGACAYSPSGQGHGHDELCHSRWLELSKGHRQDRPLIFFIDLLVLLFSTTNIVLVIDWFIYHLDFFLPHYSGSLQKAGCGFRHSPQLLLAYGRHEQ